MLHLAMLAGLVALSAHGSQRDALEVDAPIQARAEVVGSGEPGRAAGLVDLLVQQLAQDPMTSLGARSQLDAQGIVRVTLVNRPSPAPAPEPSCVAVLVEYLAN